MIGRLMIIGLVMHGLAQPAAASDFSALGKPEFARGLLLSLERRQEMSCARHWWIARKQAAMKPLTDEVRTRLAIEIGSAVEAAKAFDFQGLGDEPVIDLADPENGDLPPEWPRDPFLDVARCDRLAAAFDAGGLGAASRLLAPRAAGPIALPSTGFCLAQLERGSMGRQDSQLVGDVKLLRNSAKKSRLIPPGERAAIERDYAAFEKTSPIPNWTALRQTELADLLCLPAIAALSKRLRSEN